MSRSAGEVRERGGKWEARWYDPDGIRRSKRFTDKKMAQEYATQQQLDARRARDGRGTYLAPSKKVPTLREMALAYLDTSPGHTPKTKLGYATVIHKRWIPEFGSTPIDKIGPTDLKRWAARLGREGLKPATVANVFRVGSPIFEMAIDDEAIARNPVRRVRIGKSTEQRATSISASQVRLLADVIDPHYRALVLFDAATGLRAGELMGLQWRHLDLDGLSVNVEQSVSVAYLAESKREAYGLDSVGMTPGPTKNKRARVVRFPPFLVPLLGEPGDREAFVFTTEGGSPIRLDNWRKRFWNPAVVAARKSDPTFPERFRFHDLRHTCASLLIEKGLNAKSIQEHMGHSNISVTFDVYGHLLEDWHADVPTLLDDVFESAPVLTVIDGGKATTSPRRKKSA